MSSRRLVLSLDSDGLLTDFIGGVNRLVREVGSDADLTNIPDWTPWKHAGLTKAQVAWIDQRIGANGFCSSLPVLPGAVVGVAALHALCEVYVITTPWKSSDTWAAERLAWLKHTLGIPGSNVVQAKTKDYWWSDIFVDDKPSNVRGWRAKWGAGGYLWSTPQNQEATDLPRVSGWDELINIVTKEATK